MREIRWRMKLKVPGKNFDYVEGKTTIFDDDTTDDQIHEQCWKSVRNYVNFKVFIVEPTVLTDKTISYLFQDKRKNIDKSSSKIDISQQVIPDELLEIIKSIDRPTETENIEG